ncbi:malto-oligosyltrehalose trehalohydrolase [Thioclava sp. DLFJ4-1]|uniref:malto-oligosyltrehalose trehalohydrolase n=1 Tax=Thioclava sp. DLFJ4-1 TaxID=1915313 RepID=UPI000998296D|nr:malto-oligosyltrehalose trehalohydrolase [Thioclava sp. DLFJ4-1]OOY18129.1 malto-oligosyltrehalose trehalohydrolase [Thioclava sp. DLFJ4-1]
MTAAGDRRPLRWGAHPGTEGDWDFAIWAPAAKRAELMLDRAAHDMTPVGDGGWQVSVAARDGLPYVFRLDGTDYPDPAARRQQGDVHGPSLTHDPATFDWGAPWSGRPWDEAVILEIHIGTFTPEGTFAAAADRLPELADLGITAIEIMPVSQFHGAHGWGYDGVLLRAPHPSYGSPDEMRAFIRTAQSHGIMVILDLVLNHFGPFGNYLHAYAPQTFGGEATPWGDAIDFTRPEVRALLRETATGWIDEYRLDGLRLDAVHAIRDPSEPHFLIELLQTIRAQDRGRPIHLILEDERNLPDLRDGGYDAQWNDDWHNALHVALTGETQGYYEAHATDPFGDLARAMARGQVEEGQTRADGTKARGAPAAHLPWSAFVNANLTHDQAGNRPGGERLLSLIGDEAGAVIHALLLLMPFTPMLFMGEEVGSTAPFPFFADPPPGAVAALRAGRTKELQSIGYDTGAMIDPASPETPRLCYPYRDTGPRGQEWLQLTRELLSLRRAHVLPLSRSGKTGPGEVTRHGAKAFHARWPFAAGTLDSLVSLGAPASNAPRREPALFSMGDPRRDAFAIDMRIE